MTIRLSRMTAKAGYALLFGAVTTLAAAGLGWLSGDVPPLHSPASVFAAFARLFLGIAVTLP